MAEWYDLVIRSKSESIMECVSKISACICWDVTFARNFQKVHVPEIADNLVACKFFFKSLFQYAINEQTNKTSGKMRFDTVVTF